MSTFVNETVRCCKCGKENTVAAVASTNAFGSPDLDLRPPEMQRSTMPLWLQECSECGYVNSNLEDNNGVSKAFLSSAEYKECDGIKFENKLAFKFYRFYKTMMELDDIESAYSALLDTTWCCDDKGDETNAKKCRLRMVELFKTFPEDAKNNENNLARHIDVMRRAGLFDEVINNYSNYKASEMIIQDVISYQVKLSREKDDKCHRVEECRN